MCEQFIGRYGFRRINNSCWGLYDSRIVPKLWRPYNGAFEIMAEIHDMPDRLFLFFYSTKEDRAVDKFFADMNKLTVKDSLSIEDMHSLLRSKT